MTCKVRNVKTTVISHVAVLDPRGSRYILHLVLGPVGHAGSSRVRRASDPPCSRKEGRARSRRDQEEPASKVLDSGGVAPDRNKSVAFCSLPPPFSRFRHSSLFISYRVYVSPLFSSCGERGILSSESSPRLMFSIFLVSWVLSFSPSWWCFLKKMHSLWLLDWCLLACALSFPRPLPLKNLIPKIFRLSISNYCSSELFP